jgi:hypothetical protein
MDHEKNFIKCTASSKCEKLAVLVSHTTAFCKECYEFYKDHNQTEHLYWTSNGGSYRSPLFQRDDLHSSVRPLVMNVDAYSKLPEGLKILSNPMKAYLYSSEVVQGPVEYLEEVISTDLVLGLKYSRIKRRRVKGIEDALLEEVRNDLWSPISKGNKYLLNYISDLYISKHLSEHNLTKEELKDFIFLEGENNLLHDPCNIVSLSRSSRKRLVRAEKTLFHDFKRTLEYLYSLDNIFQEGKPVPKFEKFINSLYSEFFNEDTNSLDESKLNSYFTKVYTKSNHRIIRNATSLDIKEVGEFLLENNLLEEKEEKKLYNITLKKRISFNRKGWLYHSIYEDGGDSLVSYILDFKKSRWVEAEPFLKTASDSNLVEYITLYVTERSPCLEERILKNSWIFLKYVKSISKRISDLTLLEEKFNKTLLTEIKIKGLTLVEQDLYCTLSTLLGDGRLKCLHPTTIDIISKKSNLSFHHAKSINKRFVEGEESILKDRTCRNLYADFLLRIERESEK